MPTTFGLTFHNRRSPMKHSLTRLAFALTALYWIGGIVFAITSAALESGWLAFTWYQLAAIILL
jgi:hypothetical protein